MAAAVEATAHEAGTSKPSKDFKIPLESCLMCCQNHDSPEFGPYCEVCHAFLYPDTAAVSLAAKENGTGDDGETGRLRVRLHEERDEETCGEQLRASDSAEDDDSGCESGSPSNRAGANSRFKLPYSALYERVVRSPFCIVEKLAELHVIDDGLVENLPPESEYCHGIPNLCMTTWCINWVLMRVIHAVKETITDILSGSNCRIPCHSKAPLQRNWLRSEVDHSLPLSYEWSCILNCSEEDHPSPFVLQLYSY